MFHTTVPLPRWLMKRYSLLWSKVNDKSFDYKTVKNILNEKEEIITVVLSELKKYGWLEVAKNPRDSRKKIYHLKQPERAVKEIAKFKT